MKHFNDKILPLLVSFILISMTGVSVLEASFRYPGGNFFSVLSHKERKSLADTRKRAEQFNRTLITAIEKNNRSTFEKLLDDNPKISANLVIDVGEGMNSDSLRVMQSILKLGRNELLELALTKYKNRIRLWNEDLGFALLHKKVEMALRILEESVEGLNTPLTQLTCRYNCSPHLSGCFLPLHCALTLRDEDLVQQLLELGAKVNGLSPEERTLTLGTMYRYQRVCLPPLAFLVNFIKLPKPFNHPGYDIHVSHRSPSKREATLAKIHRLATILIEKGANIQDSDSHVPLIAKATILGSAELVELFLQHGANPNRLTQEEVSHGLRGYTKVLLSPLYIACAYGHADIVELLLRYNADITLPNGTGKTPQEVAQEQMKTCESKQAIFERILDLLNEYEQYCEPRTSQLRERLRKRPKQPSRFETYSVRDVATQTDLSAKRIQMALALLEELEPQA